MSLSFYGKILILLAVMSYFLYCAIYGGWYFLDGVDWFIHEVGHLVFMPFGQIIYILGGSIFQVLIPSLFVIYFLRMNDMYSSSFVMFWLGQSIINVSVYIKDAVEMRLPLLGGTIHDWNFLLTHFNLISSTQFIGSLIYSLGFIVIIFGGVMGMYSIMRKDKILEK